MYDIYQILQQLLAFNFDRWERSRQQLSREELRDETRLKNYNCSPEEDIRPKVNKTLKIPVYGYINGNKQVKKQPSVSPPASR